jgi:hypothetical protein
VARPTDGVAMINVNDMVKPKIIIRVYIGFSRRSERSLRTMLKK